jgi:hypothetical protein
MAVDIPGGNPILLYSSSLRHLQRTDAYTDSALHELHDRARAHIFVPVWLWTGGTWGWFAPALCSREA